MYILSDYRWNGDLHEQIAVARGEPKRKTQGNPDANSECWRREDKVKTGSWQDQGIHRQETGRRQFHRPANQIKVAKIWADQE